MELSAEIIKFIMKHLFPRAVSVIGLGKLGIPYLATIAARGMRVIGVDVNPNIVKQINSYHAHFTNRNLRIIYANIAT